MNKQVLEETEDYIAEFHSEVIITIWNKDKSEGKSYNFKNDSDANKWYNEFKEILNKNKTSIKLYGE